MGESVTCFFSTLPVPRRRHAAHRSRDPAAGGHPTSGQYGDWARAIDGSAAAAAAVEPRSGGMDAGGSAAQTSSVPSRQSSSARRS